MTDESLATALPSGFALTATVYPSVAVRGRDIETEPAENLSVYDELVTTTDGSKEFVSTVWVTVTLEPEGTSITDTSLMASATISGTTISDVTASNTTAMESSATTASSMLSTSVPTLTSALSSVASSVTPSATSSDAFSTTSSDASTDVSATDLSTTTVSQPKFCLNTERAHVWTPCTPSPSQDNSTAPPGAIISTPSTSTGTPSRPRNPFTSVVRVASSGWKWLVTCGSGIAVCVCACVRCDRCCGISCSDCDVVEAVLVHRRQAEDQAIVLRGQD